MGTPPDATLLAEVRSLVRDHAGDRDSGQAAIRALRRFWRGTVVDTRPERKAVLVDLVLRREQRTWSIAWQALVREEIIDTESVLVGAVRAGMHDSEWRDDIVFGLLDMRCRGELAFYLAYVQRRLSEVGPRAIRLLAAFTRVSVDDGLRITASFLANTRTEDRGDVEPRAAAIVGRCLSVDDAVLPRLIAEVRRQNVDAARWFARVLCDYLAKPWMADKMGRERNAAVRAALTAAADGAGGVDGDG